MESSNQATPPTKTDRILVIMAKAPRPGLVKTRLAASLPSPAVAALYRCLLDDTIELARSLHGVEAAIMCPAADVSELEHIAAHGMRVVAQEGEGLASGLASTFAQFTARGHRRVIAFNSDSPHLPTSVLEGAFEALATCDLVAGPTHDGGYYLVGAKADHSGLFEGDRMGTANALEALLARARAQRLSVHLIDSFYDIDLADDLVRLAAELRVSPARAPRTAAWLKDWGQAVDQLRPRLAPSSQL